MNEALAETEIDRLATRLAANPNEDALSLEGVDGLFCALIASPTMVAPSAYLPIILGGAAAESGAFADIEDAQSTLPLLMRYWNSIADDFANDGHVHLPYIEEPGTDNIVGRDWARGFMQGTRFASAGWSRLFQDEKEGHVITIPLVAGEIDPAWPKEPLTAERSDELLQMMFAGAARAYRYFEDDRRKFAEQPRSYSNMAAANSEPYVRSDPKVGRNEPCPCGSGKKFKKCCGA